MTKLIINRHNYDGILSYLVEFDGKRLVNESCGLWASDREHHNLTDTTLDFTLVGRETTGGPVRRLAISCYADNISIPVLIALSSHFSDMLRINVVPSSRLWFAKCDYHTQHFVVEFNKTANDRLTVHIPYDLDTVRAVIAHYGWHTELTCAILVKFCEYTAARLEKGEP